MSNYYQQEVTKYMMRRAKRRAAGYVESEAKTAVEEEPKQGGWLVSLRNWLAARGSERGSEAECEPTMAEKRLGLARE